MFATSVSLVTGKSDKSDKSVVYYTTSNVAYSKSDTLFRELKTTDFSDFSDMFKYRKNQTNQTNP